MLSYRHAFHAGNHADVLKHMVQIQLLHYLNQKDKPYWVIDTHAGAGAYALEEGFAARNGEFRDGVGRLWSQAELPPALADYRALVQHFNPDGVLRYYPGSPLVAAQCLRAQDRLRLCELHPADHEDLLSNTATLGRQALVQKTDGFAGLKAFLPPPPRRALVLIDPPYEVKEDYLRVFDTLEDALRRFATGIYALWYPCLQRPQARQLPERLRQLPVANWLQVELHIAQPAADGFGMHGSGLFILNPPWTLADTLRSTLPTLVTLLGQDKHARFLLEQGPG